MVLDFTHFSSNLALDQFHSSKCILNNLDKLAVKISVIPGVCWLFKVVYWFLWMSLERRSVAFIELSKNRRMAYPQKNKYHYKPNPISIPKLVHSRNFTAWLHGYLKLHLKRNVVLPVHWSLPENANESISTFRTAFSFSEPVTYLW